MDDAKRGILVIISSPSGAGKTTLSHLLLDEFKAVEFSVSYTTRPIRKSEKDGVDYYFVDAERFEEMVQQGEFAEYAEVFGNRYGTSRAVVEGALSSGTNVVFDVDWQGGDALKNQWPDDALMIFILPPSLSILEGRLRGRATDSEEVIQRRLRNAIGEIKHFDNYEFCIVNDDLELAYSQLRAVYLSRERGGEVGDDVGQIVKELKASGSREHAAALIRDGKKTAPSRN